MGTQPLPQKGPSPLADFRPISIVAKRLDASRIKMPLFMDVGLSPGDFVLDGDPIPLPSPLPKKGVEPPNFRPMFIVAKRLDGSRWHLARR